MLFSFLMVLMLHITMCGCFAGQCVSLDAVCDRVEDCLGGDDEHHCQDDNREGKRFLIDLIRIRVSLYAYLLSQFFVCDFFSTLSISYFI